MRAYSLIVETAICLIRDCLLDCGCSIVLCAGDSILATIANIGSMAVAVHAEEAISAPAMSASSAGA